MSHPYGWDGEQVGPDWFGWAIVGFIVMMLGVAVAGGYYSREFDEARHCRPTDRYRGDWVWSTVMEQTVYDAGAHRWWVCDGGGEWR